MARKRICIRNTKSECDVEEEVQESAISQMSEGPSARKKRGFTRMTDVWNMPSGSQILVTFNQARLEELMGQCPDNSHGGSGGGILWDKNDIYSQVIGKDGNGYVCSLGFGPTPSMKDSVWKRRKVSQPIELYFPYVKEAQGFTPHQKNVKLRWVIRGTCLGHNELTEYMCKQPFIHSNLCKSNLTIRASSKFIRSLFNGVCFHGNGLSAGVPFEVPFLHPYPPSYVVCYKSTLFPLSIEWPTGSPSSSEKTILDSGSLAKNSKFTSRGAQMPLDLKSDSNRSLAKLSRKGLGLLVIADEVADPFLFTIAVEAIVFVREVKEISEPERR
ncbi:uncharacterized protein G2W53_017864 [Senna tora]|uniref:Uncharacterized protein n=1 Tax=Senna tora TaxID=362788 RepID=A0A834WKJ6_9FABA|nr:uncharacterized protein G2W53_017864 [Senna tora]